MQQLINPFTATDLFAIAVGVALLTRGRKLYWLALGAVGFCLGLWLADRLVLPVSPGLELGVSFLLGILGAFLTVAAQRVAVSLGGFFIGGALAYWSGAWLTLPFDWQPGAWLWVVAIFGAIFGSLFAAVLFEASLLALTSLFGALLIAKASHVGAPHEGWLFLLLMCIGVIAQTGQSRRRRVKEHQ